MSSLRATLYFEVAVPICCLLAAVSVIFFTYKHITLQSRAPEKERIKSRALYYGSIVFFISVAIYYIVNSFIYLPGVCCDYLYASSFCYVTQFGIMVGLLLYRLYVIFANTPFALKRHTIYIFSTVYAATLIMGHIAAYTRNFLYDTWWHNSVGIYYFMVMGLVICFISLFLYKLITVFRAAAGSATNRRMIATITRVFLLSTVSIFWSLAFALLTSFHRSLPVTDHMIFWWKFLAWLDVYTNYLGILLGFTQFDSYYTVCFGWCDRNCRSMCMGMWLGSDVEFQVGTEIKTASIESPSTVEPTVTSATTATTATAISDFTIGSESPEEFK
eukprot:215111_1